MTTARIVTGYIPIPGHPRDAETYHALFARLTQVSDVPPLAYVDDDLDSTWLLRALETRPSVEPSVADNPSKNTLAYHAVNHQKFEWLARAADACDADVLVWCDYGLFSQPGHSADAIASFLNRLESDRLAIPGNWPVGPVSCRSVCWRFCGSMFAIPRRFAKLLRAQVERVALAQIDDSSVVEWEVNTLARVEQEQPFLPVGEQLPFYWYMADHNASQFLNYVPPSRDARSDASSLGAQYATALATPSDIQGHLRTFVDLVALLDAKKVIELGTRGGVSTIAWLHALEARGGHLWCVDLGAKPARLPNVNHWTFLQGNDCSADILDALPSPVDLVFIDTSHGYAHTLLELFLYAPFVRVGGRIVLHDTELPWPEGQAADGPFPVKRAIETFLARSSRCKRTWENHAHCNGLGILEVVE